MRALVTTWILAIVLFVFAPPLSDVLRERWHPLVIEWGDSGPRCKFSVTGRYGRAERYMHYDCQSFWSQIEKSKEAIICWAFDPCGRAK